MKIGPLSTTFSRDPNTPPSPFDKFGVCDEGNPTSIQGNPDSVGVLSQVFYHKSEAVKMSPAALATPYGTAISGIGRRKV